MRFMLLQYYGPNGAGPGVPPMSEWSAEARQAHIDFQLELNEELTELGEFVEAQALTPPEAARFVVSDGGPQPVVTDGPYPESKELLAGYRMIDVESLDRALEIATRASAAPDHEGKPIRTPIEVREVMWKHGGDV